MHTSKKVSPFELALRRTLVFGFILVVAVPQVRVTTDWLGYLPMWLVGMPAVMLWALHGFAVPKAPAPYVSAFGHRAPQAVRVRR
ncbi:hypothetical protein G7069_05095 [Lysobacter sp. HDW10]|jgi:hypothetical protein|uniref:hypothetical protein n=1 Tax=Lysobacter sp. HDW10 TaxID=2714936 RepID=UPI00140C7B72|nr:hypothetical protein [Lysobacter sp. HDW10]QIK81027.1 hypothetical protein G7069_05095 [Lysobacter sp. HDW10]